MNINDAVFIGFLVVITLLIIYFLFIHKNDNKRRNAYKVKQNKSGGAADKNAIDALKEIETIENPTAEDNFNAARIEELNVLEGDLNNARNNPAVLPDIINRFTTVINDVRERREDNLRTQRHRQNLRARLRTDMIRAGENDAIGGLGNLFIADMLFGAEHRAREIPAEIMIARMGDFAFGGLDIILGGAAQPADDFWAPVVLPMQAIALGAQQTGEQLRGDRIEVAAENAANKEEFIENYLESTITHTSDPQNVHDSSVNEDLAHTLAEVRRTSTKQSADAVLSQIRDYINRSAANGDISADKASRALNTLKVASNGSFISQFNEYENNILKCVWERSNIEENMSKSGLIKDSIVDALADSASGENTTVCAGGRASRYLGSLVLLDHDPDVGAAERQEDYKNQIIKEVAALINSEAELAAESDDALMRAVGLSYTDPSVDVDPAAEEKFNSQLRTKIIALVDSYKKHFKPHQIDDIKRDCLAAII